MCSTKSFLSCLYHVRASQNQKVILHDTLAYTAYQCCSFHALSAKNKTAQEAVETTEFLHPWRLQRSKAVSQYGKMQHQQEHVNSNTSHTACTDAHSLSAHHIALIPCTKGQTDCVPKIVFSFHLSRAMSLAPHRTPSTSSSTFFLVPGGCSHPEPLTEQAGGNGVHIIDHRANTAENFVMRKTAGTPRKINLRLALARAGLIWLR